MTITTILIFILALCALIVVHELGHFFAAKFFGIRVDEFAIGFPPRIAAIRAGETEYSVNILLFGGFVRIHGEQLDDALETDSRNFAHRSRWIQALVVVAGILMNFVLAWILFSSVYVIGMPTEVSASNRTSLSNIGVTIVEVLPNSPADKAGIEMGDVVTSIQTGTAAVSSHLTASSSQQFIQAHPDSSLVINILRGGHEKHFILRPAAGVIAADPSHKAIGVEFDDVGTLRLNAFSALISGAALTWRKTVATAEGLGGFFLAVAKGHADFSQVAGPVGIAKVGSEAILAGWSEFISFVALISINLGIINILPIPGLDGGRLLFIGIEGVRGRPIKAEIAARITVTGLALLVILMIVITYHDITQHL